MPRVLLSADMFRRPGYRAPVLLTAILALGVEAAEVLPSWPRAAVLTLDNATPERVLFVGNSYLYYNDSLHNHVRRMLAELEPELPTRYKSATIGGARLWHHDLEHLLTLGQLGVDEPFELVVLQAGSAETRSKENRARFHAEIDLKAEQARAAGGELALYMTHAYVDPHPKASDARFGEIYRAYVDAANRVGAIVIPVGLAFEASYAERSDFGLHESFDGTHPNVNGSYLAACVVIGSIYGIKTLGAQYDAYGEVDRRDARYLQRVADETVELFFGADR